MALLGRQVKNGTMIQKRVWDILDVAPEGDRVSHIESVFMFALILLNATVVVLGTVKEIDQEYGAELQAFEAFSVVIFTMEYVGRLWSCVVVEKYSQPIVGRLRFILRPESLIDLLSILPFYISVITFDLRVLRLLRLLRIFRLLKLARYSTALVLLGEAFRSRRAELGVTLTLMLIVLIIAASLMYFFEHETQPDKFTDIPTSMWWAVVTLTTIGYGDVFPVTPVGKLLGGLMAVIGVGFVALPTGIISVGFVEELQNFKKKLKKQQEPTTAKCTCPHCGKEIAVVLQSEKG